MVEISFSHITPPGPQDRSKLHYCNGWNFAHDALERHGLEKCAAYRRNMAISGSYEQGAADRWDNKPHKYGK